MSIKLITITTIFLKIGIYQVPLILTGSTQELQDFVNDKLDQAGSFTIDENGLIVLEKGKNFEQALSRQKRVFEVLELAMEYGNNVIIDVVSGDESVFVGNFSKEKIDIEDIKNWGDGDFSTSEGTLAHEIMEQIYKQNPENPLPYSTKEVLRISLPTSPKNVFTFYDRKGSNAHAKGVAIENYVNGSVRVDVYTANETIVKNTKLNKDGREIITEANFYIRYSRGFGQKTIEIKMVNNNIIK